MSTSSGKPIRSGQWPAMLTPFRADRTIDYAALQQLTDFYVGHGAAGLFASCWSSEAHLFSADETIRVCRHVRDAVKGRVQVLGGALAVADTDIIQLVRALGSLNLDAVVVSVGQVLGDCADSDAVARFQRLLDALPKDLPLGVYECPTPTHRLLTPQTLGWLAECGRFVFHKDTCCNIESIRAKVRQCRGTRLSFFNANTATLVRSLRAGGDGYCGVGSNFWPEVYTWLCDGGFRDPRAAEVEAFLLEQEPHVAVTYYPINAKRFLGARGLPITTHVRLNCRAPELALEELTREMRRAFARIGPIVRKRQKRVEART